MKRFAYILSIGISAIISCTDSPGTYYPRYSTFPDEKAISARVIELDTALFRYPFRVAVKDSIAIVMDLHNADNYFHAFTYPNWKHIVSFGKRGEGPEEMLSAETFQFDSPDAIYALDANKMQISRWVVSAENRSATRQEVIPLDKSLIRSLDFYATDSCFLIPDYLGEHRYWQVDYSGKPIKSIGEIPTEINYEQDIRPALAQAWRSFTDYNPTEVFCSTKLGASAWDGQVIFSLMGPISSTGRPTTFMMRPRDAEPTGAMIGLPVSTTSMPRTRPSVASMAMVRTTSSPGAGPLRRSDQAHRCCWDF